MYVCQCVYWSLYKYRSTFKLVRIQLGFKTSDPGKKRSNEHFSPILGTAFFLRNICVVGWRFSKRIFKGPFLTKFDQSGQKIQCMGKGI